MILSVLVKSENMIAHNSPRTLNALYSACRPKICPSHAQYTRINLEDSRSRQGRGVYVIQKCTIFSILLICSQVVETKISELVPETIEPVPCKISPG
jgi:hypothetical protein